MRKSIAFVVAVVFSVAGAIRAAEQPAKDRTVHIDHPVTVGDQVLPEGTYRVDLIANSDTARFVQGTRVVAEVPCAVNPASVVYRGNSVHLKTGQPYGDRLVKIVFAKSKLALEFPESATAANSNPPATVESASR